MNVDSSSTQIPEDTPDLIWLSNHAISVAANAWESFAHGQGDATFTSPSSIHLLHRRGRRFVLMLNDAMHQSNGTAHIIARYVHQKTAELESAVYRCVLSRLTVPTLRLLGVLQVSDGDQQHRIGGEDRADLDAEPRTWMFIEAGEGQKFDPFMSLHRKLAARWLAELHLKTFEIGPIKIIPSRGVDYFFSLMNDAEPDIRKHLHHPQLTAIERSSMQTVLEQMRLVKSRWEVLKSICDVLPIVFCHGDYAARNIIIRNSAVGDTKELLVYDWEDCFQGTAAMDFIQARPGSTCESANIDFEEYCDAVKNCWPLVTVETLHKLGLAGRILWFIVAIAGEGEAIACEDFGKHTRNLRMYTAGLNDTFRGLGWPIVNRRTGRQEMDSDSKTPISTMKNRRLGWGSSC